MSTTDTTAVAGSSGKVNPGQTSRRNSPEELHKACRQFEEIFLRMVLKEAHIDRAMGGESEGSSLYGDMVIESMAKSVASGGGLGMAEMLYRQLSPKNAVAGDSSSNHQDTRNTSEKIEVDRVKQR